MISNEIRNYRYVYNIINYRNTMKWYEGLEHLESDIENHTEVVNQNE